MHELPVTQSLLEIALRHAEDAGAKRILSLNVTIGQLASVVDDSIQFYWDLIAAGTAAEGARLNFRRIPALMECLDCGRQFEPGDRSFDCPDCHSSQVHLIGGSEFYLDSIDVA